MKYRCIKKCFYNATLYLTNEVVELPEGVDCKYLVPMDSLPKEGKKEESPFMTMSEDDLRAGEYKLADLRDFMGTEFGIQLAANTAGKTVIAKFIEARIMYRK